MYPFDGRNRVTQPYKGSSHTGIDIVGDDSNQVRCPKGGTVCRVQHWDGVTKTGMMSYGNLVDVQDSEGKIQRHAHLKFFSLSVGDKLSAGGAVGVMGNTGNSFGAHLHFEVLKSDGRTREDPAAYLGIPNLCGTYSEKSGWIFEDNQWVFYEQGIKQKNKWVKTDGYWYYLGSNGVMSTGWIEVKGEIFFLNNERKTVGGVYIPLGACIITKSNGALTI